jgi:5-methylcytosine-specific restriction enzyme A
MPGGWQGSTRRTSLPPNWPQLCAAVLDRDSHRCTWIEDNRRCPAEATEVDHIQRGDDHRMVNLRALCAWHHGRKSSAEGNAARWAVREQRAPEAHPGMTTN